MNSLIIRYENSFKRNRNLPALTDYTGGKTVSYFQLARAIDHNHRLFRDYGIGKGDRIALVGKNSIDWITLYISVITYGATVVPILPDFNPIDIEGIVRHCGAVVLFADRKISDRLDRSAMPQARQFIYVEDMDCSSDGDPSFDIEKLKYADVGMEDTVVISYTSGTTGSSKGVMIPLRSLSANVDFALFQNFFSEGSHSLALLPLAHAYGCTFDMLTPLTAGSHIFVLGMMPTPRVLLEAMGKVKPSLICTVPLVMEKLVHRNVMPQLEKQPVKTMLKLPVVRQLVFRSVRKKLLDAFGGKVMEVNMGGAALAPDVENFLSLIHFPYTIGYGMTECAPLISYSPWRKFRKGSCGHLLPGMEVKVESAGFEGGLGEICVRGDNVMQGYFRNPEATQNALKDGWLHTGDVGFVDKDSYIHLRGRCKSMILTSSGQNIYPEEIECKLNRLDGVAESLVYEKDGKLIALVVPDSGMMENNDGEKVKAYMKALLARLNSLVAPFEKISEIITCSEPFEKTPKQSIKRFLYPKKAKFL